MSDPEGLAIARRLIAEVADKKTGFLDLGMLGLTELPDELFALSHILRLSLGNWISVADGKYQRPDNSIASNRLSGQAFQSLRDLNLESLYVEGVPLTNLSSISGMTNLKSLHCRSTQVSDLSPLSSITNLQSLYCRNTQVSDLSPLSSITNLQSLYCGDTQVSDLSPLAGLRTFRFLNASRCKLKLFPLALLRTESPIKIQIYETKIPGIPAEVLSQRYYRKDSATIAARDCWLT